MDDDDFKQALRVIVIIIFGVMGAFLGVYLLFVAGYAAHAYINKIDPDPPVCIHSQTCKDSYGALTNCVVRYDADDAGHPINLPNPPVNPTAAGK